MTRINTNVSSLVAQKTLTRTNSQLQTSLTRLSTGLRINVGKDDPAGLIASEALGSDIVSTQRAITNSERANQMIATADSAIGQVSSLLNDVRGLVTEAANDGAMSAEQIAANQLQIDSSLEAINRIAKTTQFQGKKLLDGSLDFITSAGAGYNTVKDMEIQQANLGATGQVGVSVSVSSAASKAQITNNAIPASTAAVQASGTMTFHNNAAQATGTIALTNGSFDLTTVAAGAAAGAAGNSVDVVFQEQDIGAAGTVNVGFAGNTLTITVDDGGATITQIADAIDGYNGGADFVTSNRVTPGNNFAAGDIGTMTTPLAGGLDAGDDVITVKADTAGATANGVTVTLIENGAQGAGTASAAFNGNNIEVTVRNAGDTSMAAIVNAIDGLAGYSATLTTATGDGLYKATAEAPPAAATLASGAAAAGGLAGPVVVEIGGKKGSQVFQFGTGTSLDQMVSAINLVKDATGVEAANTTGNLQLNSTDYGSKAYVAVNVISDGTGGAFTAGLSGTRDEGTDIAARVNGVEANGDGNTLSINTATLSMKMTVNDGSSTNVDLTVTGGGALFQLGPDVVSNQQARIGITSLNTGKLGGSTGRLYELASGGTAALGTDTTKAAAIVDEVLTKVTSLRGRLGAFQRTTLETNIASLNDTLENLTSAQSSIRDADFASESANLTRAQILVQSGTAVLAIANQNPQNVLSLLRG